MTVEELRTLIEDLPDDTEVRIAFQPTWPLEYTIDPDNCAEQDGVLWLAEGYQIGYLPGGVSEELGWR